MTRTGLNSEKGLRQTNNLIVKLENFRRSLLETFQRFLTPEGIYRIEALNPNSHYHLSMKINYPNEFDLVHAWQEGRTDPGSDIFIHGRAASIGCLAMGDKVIEELFVLTAHVGAEKVKVIIAPYDPRISPLETDSEELPEWTPELYSLISREIKALSPWVKSAKSGSDPSRLVVVSQPILRIHSTSTEHYRPKAGYQQFSMIDS
jgi:hypothetical protein